MYYKVYLGIFDPCRNRGLESCRYLLKQTWIVADTLGWKAADTYFGRDEKKVADISFYEARKLSDTKFRHNMPYLPEFLPCRECRQNSSSTNIIIDKIPPPQRMCRGSSNLSQKCVGKNPALTNSAKFHP